MVRFLHAADVHLGFRQYGSEERFQDFGQAFRLLIEEAIARQADCVLLAGDVFNKQSLDPPTLLSAVYCLERLKAAGIPTLAIEGNHEAMHGSSHLSWIDYLARTDLLITLSADYQEGHIQLSPWDGVRGAYVDLPQGIRVLGLRYYGASTPRVVSDLVEALPALPGPRPAYTILMLHAGLQGILDQYAAILTREQIEPLRQHIDYLALGHIHKPFVQDDWIYNPGSLETNSVTEVAWPDRGFFVVDVDTASGSHAVTRVQGKRRAFELLAFSVDGYDEPAALYDALQGYVSREATPDRVAPRPVVELRLTGVLSFNHADLNTGHIEQMISKAFGPLHCRVRDMCRGNDQEIIAEESLSRPQLEHHVLQELVERDVRRRAVSSRWADMILRVKRMALAQSDPSVIVEELRDFLATTALGASQDSCTGSGGSGGTCASGNDAPTGEA